MVKLLDRDYRIAALHYNLPMSKTSADLTGFLIEKARLRFVIPFFIISTVTTAGLGWALYARVHIAIPLVLQLITGSTQVETFAVCGTLLTNLHPA